MAFISDEELHETIINLEGLKEREKRLNQEINILLDGLKVLAMSVNERETFMWLMDKMREVIQIEEAFILSEKENLMIPMIYSNKIFKDSTWEISNLINRTKKGEIIVCLDVNQIPDWIKQPDTIRSKVTSALYVPLITREKTAILVCTHSKRAFFTRFHRETISRFSLLLAEALINAENRTLLIKKQNELSLSFKRLEEKTVELQKTRDALWGEMQLAKKIQTVLLPKHPAISGFQIVAYMLPAEEVGGDYYDIINVDSLHWLVIGDVSGHGVSAGLIMMMVQTSIHSILVGSPTITPKDLLIQVNKVIKENIKRLNENKYMTITVIAYIKDGKFYYSGLHQDIMIFRAATKEVEQLETRGMWLGLVDDITETLYNDNFNLNTGDVILLYTDGITEAQERDSKKVLLKRKKEMFGIERLKNCFASLGERNLEEIKKGILKKLKPYESSDDITMVIIKRIE